MDEERLIQLVEMRSYLYDTSSFHYKNLNKVAAGWEEIARELEVSDVEQCRKKWKSLRDTFTRIQKLGPPSGSEVSGRKEWRHLKSMWFLLPHLRERSSKNSSPSTSQTTPGNRRLRSNQSAPLNAFQKRLLEAVERDAEQANMTDEDMLFVHSLVPPLKRLSQQKKADVKVKIHQLLYEAEFN